MEEEDEEDEEEDMEIDQREGQVPDAEPEEEPEYDWLRVESAIWVQDTGKLTFRVRWDDNTPSDEIEGSTPTFNEVKL